MGEEKYLPIEKLAEHYQVSVSTIRSWMRTGVIPSDKYIKIGKTFRFKVSEIDEALRMHNSAKQAKLAAVSQPNNNPDQDL